MTDTERIEKLEAELAALRKLVEHTAMGGPIAYATNGKLIPVTGQKAPRCNGNPYTHHWTGPDGRCICQSYSTSFAGSQ